MFPGCLLVPPHHADDWLSPLLQLHLRQETDLQGILETRIEGETRLCMLQDFHRSPTVIFDSKKA